MNKIVFCTLAFLTLAPAVSTAADDPRDTDSPFGVLDFLQWDSAQFHHHYDLDKVERAAAMMEEAGVGMVRMDILWADVEPQKGTFVFAKYDKILDALDRHHIKVLAILEYNPNWRKDEWNAAPIVDDYLAYASTTVAHFKDHIRYWEIWNEPDSKTYWEPQDDMTAYSRLLKAVYPVIKKEDPTAKVVLGGMTENGTFAIRHIYQKAGKNSFDVVNIHPFVNSLKPNAIQTMKGIHTSLMRVMTEFKDGDKPIWFTEIGCPGVPKPSRENGWWQGPAPTEEQQAEWVTAVYTNALQWKGVQKVFWAFFRDTNDFFHNGVDYFGLIRDDMSEKPAYDAYKKVAHASGNE
jgi:polysaccharide biosynthesis protein PslG